jgi:argininosuccinate synthase
MRIVLAYSGDLASSVAIPRLADRHGAEVIAATMDLGQGKEALEEIRDRALATGAVRAHVLDVRDLYIRDFIVRGLKAGILWRGGASNAGALAGPLVAQKLVEIARIEQARAVAHADRAGSAAPVERTIRVLAPELSVFAAADGAWTADRQLDYARERRVMLPAALGGGVPTAIAVAPPDEPALVDIAFERGVPIGVNGVVMPAGDLITSLDILTRAHGVETAAYGVLHDAHAALQAATLPDDARAFGETVAAQYARLIRDGGWFTPLRAALDAYVDAIEQHVRGTVRVRLFQRTAAVVACDPSAAAPSGIVLVRA